MERTLEFRYMVIDYHRFVGKVSGSRPEVAEQENAFAFQLGRIYFLTDPQTEANTRTQHRVAEDRAGCYTVSIVVCEDLDELVAADLFCNSFSDGFKGHGYLRLLTVGYLDNRISVVSGL